jgi:hypothetical protein
MSLAAIVRNGVLVLSFAYGMDATLHARRLQRELDEQKELVKHMEERNKVYEKKLTDAIDVLYSGSPDEQRQLASDIEFMLY